MPIDFELSENARAAREHFHQIATERMRPISRKYDEHEHELPGEWVDWYWNVGRKQLPPVLSLVSRSPRQPRRAFAGR